MTKIASAKTNGKSETLSDRVQAMSDAHARASDYVHELYRVALAARGRGDTPADPALANRAEAAWLHAWRAERGQPDEAGESALAGTDRDIYRYVSAERDDGERFAISVPLSKRPTGHHVELAEAMRSFVPDADECRAQLLAADAAQSSEERNNRFEIATHSLFAALIRTGLVPLGFSESSYKQLASKLRRVDRDCETSVLVRIALTDGAGWDRARAKAAVRALDRTSTATANKQR